MKSGGEGGVASGWKHCPHLLFSSVLFSTGFTLCLHFCLVETETPGSDWQGQRWKSKPWRSTEEQTCFLASTLSLLSPSGFSHFSLFAFYLSSSLSCFFLFSSNFLFFLSVSVSLSSSLLWSAISPLYIPAVSVCVCLCVCLCVRGEILAHVLVCIFCVILKM